MKRTQLVLFETLVVCWTLSFQLSSAHAQVTTFTDPTPAHYDYFGSSVSAVGTDRVLIGAYGDSTGTSYAGAAYLFTTGGTLLTTFSNPAPAVNGWFGNPVAALGADRVLIGAPFDSTAETYAGVAYLFSTDGELLTTFANPSPAANEYFGNSVAVVGTDQVLIGAPGAGTGYLFDTNGVLLTPFAMPTPTAYNFGSAVAAVGTDRMLIGAAGDSTSASQAGAAYLFSSDGTLLATFAKPVPAAGDHFGSAVAVVGADLVLIGAYGDSTGAYQAGAAYLFNTNGTLLTTFTNPTPASSDYFGSSVAAVGTDRVLIGAPFDSTGATQAGAAYLFHTDGTLLATFTKPTPAAYDQFGTSVAAVGTNQVLVGAPNASTGGVNGDGGGYLFSLAIRPSLSIRRDPQLFTITVSWPALAEGWVLERTNALPTLAAAYWPQVPPPYQTNAGMISVSFTNNSTTGNQFFRLHKP